MKRHSPFVTSVLLVLVAVSLVACGKKDHAGGTQVVAKVNGDEISVHQLNFLLGRMGNLDEKQSKIASRQVLAKLVDEQLIVSKAIKNKLDRDPSVLQAVENAKREILVQAFLQQQMSSVKKPTNDEINNFYNAHPEFFEHRKIYRLQELVVTDAVASIGEIEAAVRDKKSIADIAAWLNANNHKFAANNEVRGAEQLPLPLVTRLNQMKEGEFVILPSQNNVNILLLAGTQEQPVSKDKATPVIEQFILNQKRNEIAKRQLDELRTTAKIEFVGEFADMNKASGNSVTTTKDSNQVNQAEVQSKSDSKPVASDAKHIEKGLSGL